jgi:hypothetical protein
MAKLKVKDIHPALDGEYELDPTFTNWELHAIKQLSGITAGELQAAFAAGDNDLVVAVTMVALMRAGKISGRTPWASEQVESLWNASLGKITAEFGEGDESPPETSAPDEESSASNGTSGVSSDPAGANLVSVPSPTGSPV